MIRIVVILYLVITMIGCHFAMASPVKRIITLSPHTTELAYAAGLGNKIVGVSERSDYPPQAKNMTKVASYNGIDIEKILALHPDLVIAWPAGNSPKALNKLRQMGIKLFYSNTQHLDDIADNIDALAQYADDPSIGIHNASLFRTKLTALRKKYSHVTPISYFYQLSEKPIITIAQDSWPSEVFHLCGGVNVFENSPAHYPQVGLEQVIVARPQVIFNSRHAVKNLTMWDHWTQIPAVRHHHIWLLNSDWINRATPRTLNAITEVCTHFDQVRENQ